MSKKSMEVPFWPKAHFWAQGVPENVPNSTWRGQVGTLGSQEGPSGSPKGGPKMGSKKGSKRSANIRAFWMLKTCKSTVR